MASRTIQGVTIECIQGDIADQPGLGAVVNAAKRDEHHVTHLSSRQSRHKTGQ